MNTAEQRTLSAAPAAIAPASAKPPDLGHLVHEMRCFLELGAVQLEAAVKEADGRVESLASAVTAMSADARELESQAMQLLSGGHGVKHQEAREGIQRLAESLAAHVRIAITSLQFYDKLTQRLAHVRDGLVIPADAATAVTGTVARHRNDSEWESIIEQVRTRYSMVEERVLFDFMMRGLSADQMLKALVGIQSTSPGETELF